ncbi:MAG TPA: hypothetical protein VEX60_00205 [Pyrinomonadaceae bacterium]|nr:hypothetical protein [Pyrinomonadaceae bacterium]
MKEGFDKEIDSLLRRRIGAGAGARAFGDGGTARAKAHLDADELSAFAEGALPASARIAAASHMADCDECRGLAVGLARASGAEAELERRAVAARVPASESVAARSRGWFSSLFTPRALRYAAPALALCLVAVVSFVALRSRWKEAGLTQQTAESRSPQLEVAKNQPTDSPLASTNANASGIAPGTFGDESRNAGASGTSAQPPADTFAGAKDAGAGAGSPVVAEDKKADEPSPPPPSAKSEGPVDVAPPMSKAGPPVEVGEVARGESKEKSARQSQPEEEAVTNEYSMQQRRASNQARGIDNNIQMPDGARGQKRGAADNASNSSVGGRGELAAEAPRGDRDRAAPKPNAPASRRARSSEEQRERSEDDEAARDSDARSVAGHRFRRVGGAWVDVNYKSSMASTGVRRGTDAYRALVADIPEIGRVASQLGGEVVVVVKGRAYRIR